MNGETRPVALLTGGTDGVGKATAIELANKGFAIVLAARNGTKAEGTKREIESTAGGSVDVIVSDLSSLESVQRLADTFKQRFGKLDVLINNAGVLLNERRETQDGYESMYQTNYLSHFLLTQLLLDELQKSDQGRIISLGSSIYTMGKFDLTNLQSERRFSPLGAYASAKLFVLMSSITLAERLCGTGVTVNVVHPGVVRTQMMTGAKGLFKVLSLVSLPFSISPSEGARTSVYLATSPEVKDVTGKYFTKSAVARVKNAFNTEQNRRVLWDVSMQQLRGFLDSRKRSERADVHAVTELIAAPC